MSAKAIKDHAKEDTAMNAKNNASCRSFPLWKTVRTGIHIGYILFIVVFIILAANEQTVIDEYIEYILIAPFAVGQYCDFNAKGEGRYAYISRFISTVITIYEVFIMSAAVLAFATIQAKNQDPSQQTIQEYRSSDISKLTVEISSGANCPRYYCYSIDMEKRLAKKTVYTYKYSYSKGKGEYVPVSSEHSFSEEYSAELVSLWDKALLIKWNDAYCPEFNDNDIDNADTHQSQKMFFTQMTRNGHKAVSIEFKDGTSRKTIIYDGADGLPKYCKTVLDSIYSLCEGATDNAQN